ncbi:hypothetical protein A2865_00955 [Candidatus Woesebacteria bacterium RIFCSPHIGHO2_01_FULL_39_17]|uniref:DUF2283 domain-containing protein n=4 Tax=Microgenomates group TaxID=1794810 RepID=A0A0H4TVT0_9BACT|nr:Uncharacterized protein [uncultured Microgenomates bacterium Rifle_16ft_4_minimus_954]KKQ51964.1 MAG: hypothetical protein US72_C0011G0063 [Microgenomates group bacterium GW2011_GWC1_38_12]KKQ94374.1 MAG: hypothetical protein UT19_C0002G0016 [Candidatus Woesebacteria bacterium GW2011_GWB1_39_10b]KKR14386.1 MAG: hypothetical protein UT40_C0001G0016 [Candidatus Woesebacteria bacterium GW2011_GWA1_39_21b]OGM23815.1 MAG: hypothetical protein A2865_00955 [Candidatus Woesebacteria bacterium RIFCSP
MKYRYDKEDDVLMIWFSKEPVDYAEQVRGVIVHFSKKNRPVLMEILEASSFLKETSKNLPRKVKQEILSV